MKNSERKSPSHSPKLIAGSIVCGLIALLFFGGLWPDIDGRNDDVPKIWMALGFTAFSGASVVLFHRSDGVAPRRSALEIALWFAVIGAVVYALAS